MSLETELGIVKVHIVSSDVPKPVRGCIRTVANRLIFPGTGSGTANDFKLALPLAPNRKRAVITVVGQSNDVIYVCTSASDAANIQGAPVLAGASGVEIWGTNEIWIGAVNNVNVVVGILADYGD